MIATIKPGKEIILAPKVTGMLVDFGSLALSDILEHTLDQEKLISRVNEALDLLASLNLI